MAALNLICTFERILIDTSGLGLWCVAVAHYETKLDHDSTE